MSLVTHVECNLHVRGGLHKLRSMIAPTCLNWVACSQSRFMVKVSENSWSSSTKCVCVCVSLQSVPECDDKKRVSEEDDRGRKEEETEEEEEDERNGDEGFMGMTPLLQAHHAMERMEEFVHKVQKTKQKNTTQPPHTHKHTSDLRLNLSEKIVGERSTF